MYPHQRIENVYKCPTNGYDMISNNHKYRVAIEFWINQLTQLQTVTCYVNRVGFEGSAMLTLECSKIYYNN